MVYTKFAEGFSTTLRFFVLDGTRYYRNDRPLTHTKIRAIYRILTKKSKNIFMTSKVFHIYAKGKCIAHSIPESDFKETWETAQRLVGLMKTDYEVEDLDYEEVVHTHSQEEASY